MANLVWGKAHINNSIGYGQGNPNNSIGWGSIYADSESGETALVGDPTAGGAAADFTERVIADGGTIEIPVSGTQYDPDATLVTTPNAYEPGTIFSLQPADGSGDWSVSRNSTATRVNSEGLIESVSANVARIDYRTGEPKWLIEGQATNLLSNGENVGVINATVTAVVHTFSYYGTGSVAISGAFVGNVVSAGNRTTFTFTPAAGSVTLTPTGDVTKWQLETGSFATSYIETNGSIATRLADNININDEAKVQGILQGQDEFSVVLDYNYHRITNASKFIFNITPVNVSDANDRFVIFQTSSGTITMFNNVAGQNIQTSIIINAPLGQYKIGVVKKGNIFDLYLNGSYVASQNFITGIYTQNFSKFILGSTSTASYINNSINSLKIYPTALSDAEMIEKTTL